MKLLSCVPIALAGGMGLYAALRLVLYISDAPFREHVVAYTCQSNLRVIGRALAIYQEDANGLLPPAANWMDRISIDKSHPEYERCPRVKPGEYGYAMNATLSSKAPLETDVLVFEMADLRRNAVGDPAKDLLAVSRHERVVNVLYGDWHPKPIKLATY